MATTPPPIVALLHQALAQGSARPPLGGAAPAPGLVPGAQAPPGLMPGPPVAPPPMPDFGHVIVTISQMPSPYKETAALRLAREAVGIAINSIAMRSPRVAKECAAALMNLDQAMDALDGLPLEPVQPPPPGMPISGTPSGPVTPLLGGVR